MINDTKKNIQNDDVNHLILMEVKAYFLSLKDNLNSTFDHCEDDDFYLSRKWYEIGKAICCISTLLDMLEE